MIGFVPAGLYAGTARAPAKSDGRPLPLDSRRAAAVAAVLGADIVLSARHDGRAHISEGPADLEPAFHDAGLAPPLHAVPHGTTVALRPWPMPLPATHYRTTGRPRRRDMPVVRIDLVRGRSPEVVRGRRRRENGPDDRSFADGRAQYVEGGLPVPGR